MGPPRLLVSPSFDLSADKPNRPCPPIGFLRVGEYPANGYPLVELGLRTRGETMRPWTEAETRLLRARIRKKVSAEEIAKTLGRHVGSVKKKARELGLIPIKRGKAKTK